ncbi:hypothetical protein D9M69_377810 [compost metagenome]
MRPGRQRWHQLPEQLRQAALDAVHRQGDEQDQADHQALEQAHLALDARVLGAQQRLAGVECLLQGGDLGGARRGQPGALLDQRAGALQFGRVAAQQAGQFALEGDAAVCAGALLGIVGQAHQRGEVVGPGAAGFRDAEQRQGGEAPGLFVEGGQFALEVGEQFVATAGDQLVAGMAEAQQVLAGAQQRCAVVAGGRLVGGGRGVLVELVEQAGQFALGLQQQALRVAGQLAGGEQFAGAELLQFLEARPQRRGERGRQGVQLPGQGVQRLVGGLVAQGVAAGQVVADIARHRLFELLGQAEVLALQLVGALEGALRPPEGGAERQADDDQQQGVEVGEGFQAHGAVPTASTVSP